MPTSVADLPMLIPIPGQKTTHNHRFGPGGLPMPLLLRSRMQGHASIIDHCWILPAPMSQLVLGRWLPSPRSQDPALSEPLSPSPLSVLSLRVSLQLRRWTPREGRRPDPWVDTLCLGRYLVPGSIPVHTRPMLWTPSRGPFQ